MTLVTLEALLVLANWPALSTLLDPYPVIKSQIQPISGIIDIVDITSNQKKNDKK